MVQECLRQPLLWSRQSSRATHMPTSGSSTGASCPMCRLVRPELQPNQYLSHVNSLSFALHLTQLVTSSGLVHSKSTAEAQQKHSRRSAAHA